MCTSVCVCVCVCERERERETNQLVSSHRHRWRGSPSSTEGRRLREECTVCSSVCLECVVINARCVVHRYKNPDLIEDPYLSILSWLGHSMSIVVK